MGTEETNEGKGHRRQLIKLLNQNLFDKLNLIFNIIYENIQSVRQSVSQLGSHPVRQAVSYAFSQLGSRSVTDRQSVRQCQSDFESVS